MSKHAIYVIPICIGLLYLGYKKIKSLEHGIAEEQFDKDCLAELKNKLGDSVSIVDVGDSGKSVDRLDGEFYTNTIFYKVIDSAAFLISPDKGEYILFKSILKNGDDTTRVHYTYCGYEERSKMHWIAKETYWKKNSLLVNQSDGGVYEIIGYPQSNPTYTRIFSKQDPSFWMYESCSPGFQLWKKNNDSLTLEYDVKLQGYYIMSGRWVSNNKLIIEVGPATQYMVDAEAHSQQFELTFPDK